MKRVMVFGANGRLGRRIVEAFEGDYEVLPVTRRHSDLADITDHSVRVAIEIHKPDIVINCAAMNGLEACDANPGTAVNVNTVAPAVMAHACSKIDAKFIHFSSDYANIGGRPWGIYGASKAAGEQACLWYDGATVIRLMSIYDPRDMGGALGPVKQFREGRGTRDNPIKVVYQETAPTYTGWIAEVTRRYCDQNTYKRNGLFYLAAQGSISKVLFGYTAVQLFCEESTVYIENGDELPLPRPKTSIFGPGTNLVNIIGGPRRTIEENLAQAHAAWQTENHAGSGSRSGSSA